MAVSVRAFSDHHSFVEAVAALLANELARESETPHAVMLSGGSTPLAAYDALAKSGVRASQSVRVLFSDERMVPANSPQSNYGNATPMLSAVGVGTERIMRVRTELPLEVAADRYDADIAAFFDGGGRITLGLLGIGADGHTASLFTLADVERGSDRWAIAVPRAEGPDRVSVTTSLIRRIERVVFVVAGPDKDAVVDALLSKPASIPAGKATEGMPHVELWRI